MDNNIIDSQLSNTHINNRFKSFQLDKIDKSYESDSQTINNNDDEYGEASYINHINKLKKKKLLEKNKKQQINKKEKTSINLKDKNNCYQHKKPKYRNNSFEKEMINKSVKNLMEINTKNKQEVLDILLTKNLVQKKVPDQNQIIKEKNRNKFYYIESKTKPFITNKLQNTYGRKGFQIEIEEGNPEFIKDMNYAKYKLQKKIANENKEVAQILFSGKEQITNPHKSISLKDIGKKIKNIIDKKRKNLEELEFRLYEQQKLEQTFTPCINHRKKDGSKRNLEIFLKDQNEFQKKVKNKKRKILMKSQSEQQLLFKKNPVINKNSQEIAKKLGMGKDVYERLYKRNTYNMKKKEFYIKYLEQTDTFNNTSNNSKSKENKYSYVQSRINIWNNTNKDKNNKENILNNSNSKKITRKSRSSTNLIFEKKRFNTDDLATNRLLWNKFNKKFEKILENLKYNKNNKNNNNNGQNNNVNNNDEIDEKQYYELLYNLGMINYLEDKNESKKKEEINDDINIKLNNTTKNQEVNSFTIEDKKLVKYSFNLLKLGNNKVKTSNLKYFLTFLLNLHNYYFYHQYKLNHSPEELKKLYPLDKYKKEEIPLMMIKKYNQELLSLTDKYNPNNTKYFYLNKNDKNKIVITLENHFYIKKDFSLFSLNYVNHKQSYVPKSILELKNRAFYKNVYPQIIGGLNTSTNLASENKSIGKSINKSSDKSSNKSQNKAKNIEHIDKLLLLEKRRIAKNEKIKEELEDKKIKECTFKPKINLTSPLYLNLTKEKYKKFLTKKNTDNKKLNRIEEMYQQGKQTVKSRKDRSIMEIEVEQQLHECTFHPQLHTFQNKKQEKVKFKNDIYNEKQYISLYERLKKGRLNQLVKESNNDRYELNDKLKKYIKDSKKYNLLNSQNYCNKTLPHYYNNNTMYIDDNPSTQEIMAENSNLYIDINNSDKKNNNKIKQNNESLINTDNNNNNNSEKNNSEQKKLENKEPLFIIDVNIEEGLTKKIYIFAGDTPKILAQKFCKENKLDIETQNKLESIINNQMKNPLGKIDEENFSSSDKN